MRPGGGTGGSSRLRLCKGETQPASNTTEPLLLVPFSLSSAKTPLAVEKIKR